MKKIYFSLSIFPILMFGQVDNYYSGTENLSGYTLKSKLNQIISQKAISWHYDDLKSFYATTDVDRYYENDGTLLDIYAENPEGIDAYNYSVENIISSANAEGQGWNREHAMPQSTYSSRYPMYSDLFYVIPTDARINQLRSNYPYGVAGATTYYNFTNGSRIGNSAIPNAQYTGRVYEPIDEFKGDVARMLLYFAVRYEGKFGGFTHATTPLPTTDRNQLDGTEERAFEPSYINMLINWHNLDPVSQKEIDRNNYVYEIQKNRNPFIDHPEWVNVIWNQTLSSVAPQTVADLQALKTSAYFVDLKWNASSSQDVIGYEVYKNGELYSKTNKTNIIVDRLDPSTTYDFHIVAYNNAYLKSPVSSTISVTTVDSDQYAKDLFITKYLEGTSNNRALEVVNLTGHEVDLKNYRLSMQKHSGTNYYFDNALELEGVLAHGESFVAINPYANFSCFNTSDARFVTAAPALTFNGSNYVELNYKNSTVDAIGVKGETNSNTDRSLYRLASVKNPSSVFNISEWETFSKDYCVGLGAALSVKDNVTNQAGLLYPNPVTDILFVKNLKVDHFQILDANGRIIKSRKQIDDKSGLNVSNLPSGVYYLKTTTKTYPFIKK